MKAGSLLAVAMVWWYTRVRVFLYACVHRRGQTSSPILQIARVLFSFFFLKDLFLFCLCLYGTRVCREGMAGSWETPVWVL